MDANGHQGRPRVLIAGGGAAAIEAVLALHQLCPNRLDLEVITPARDFAYRPMSVLEPFGFGHLQRFDITRLVTEAGSSHRIDALASVDMTRSQVLTSRGDRLTFDALLVCCGARTRVAVPGAITFWGFGDTSAFKRLLAKLEAAEAQQVIFAAPGGVGWQLPLYELALLTRSWLEERGPKAGLTIVTPETNPLSLFGVRASAHVATRLRDADIAFEGGRYPIAADEEGLTLVPKGHLRADAVVALPRLLGPRINGLPSDEHGFIPVDEYARVEGASAVYAAGDATSFPIKEGGLAAQQADVAAESIAASFGAQVEPQPFRPVIRGVLLTGEAPTFMRAALLPGTGETSEATLRPLWQPSSKILGRYLTRFLDRLGDEDERSRPVDMDNIELDLSGPDPVATWIGA